MKISESRDSFNPNSDETIDKLFNRIKHDFEEEFEGVVVEPATTVKNNNIHYSGASIRDSDDAPAPTFWLDPIAQDIKEGRTTIDIAVEAIKDGYKNCLHNRPKMPVLSSESAKENLFATVINAQKNSEFLSDAPHTIIEDLAVVLRFGSTHSGSAAVDNGFLKLLELTPSKAKKIAISNTISKHFNVLPLGEYFNRLCHDDSVSESNPKLNHKMYVISNDDFSLGAVIPFINKDARKMVLDIMEEEYYILPSSIHECIAIGANEKDVTPDRLRQLVTDINSSHIIPNEVLSNNVYFVDEKLDISLAP